MYQNNMFFSELCFLDRAAAFVSSRDNENAPPHSSSSRIRSGADCRRMTSGFRLQADDNGEKGNANEGGLQLCDGQSFSGKLTPAHTAHYIEVAHF